MKYCILYRIDYCMDYRMDYCIDYCINYRIDYCINYGIDYCINYRIDYCIDYGIDSYIYYRIQYCIDYYIDYCIGNCVGNSINNIIRYRKYLMKYCLIPDVSLQMHARIVFKLIPTQGELQNTSLNNIIGQKYFRLWEYIDNVNNYLDLEYILHGVLWQSGGNSIPIGKKLFEFYANEIVQFADGSKL